MSKTIQVDEQTLNVLREEITKEIDQSEDRKISDSKLMGLLVSFVGTDLERLNK